MSSSVRSLSVTLPVTPVLPDPKGGAWAACLGCGSSLELHQPDAAEPRRFVGTCDECGRWFMLDWAPDSAEGLMVVLPTHEELLAAFRP